jgi:predicted DNA-binding protein (MmcQ/YjbR family)
MTIRRDTPADGKALARFRALCLALPETSEAASWGHPNFRAGKKTFEVVEGRPSLAFRLDGADVERLLRDRGFFATPYGRGQWASAWADVPLDWEQVRELLLRSYRVVATRRLLLALEGAPREPRQRTTTRKATPKKAAPRKTATRRAATRKAARREAGTRKAARRKGR